MTTPICFLPFTDQKNNFIHRTGSIDTIFENTTVSFYCK